jgi:hypothetical protein
MLVEEAIVTVAAVEVTDACRVNLWQFRRGVDYSPEQAFRLAEKLSAAATEATAALRQQEAAVAERAAAITAGEVF